MSVQEIKSAQDFGDAPLYPPAIVPPDAPQ